MKNFELFKAGIIILSGFPAGMLASVAYYAVVYLRFSLF